MNAISVSHPRIAKLGVAIALSALFALQSPAAQAADGRKPVVKSFDAQPDTVSPGGKTILKWDIRNADRVRLFANGREISCKPYCDARTGWVAVNAKGRRLSVDETTTFELQATTREGLGDRRRTEVVVATRTAPSAKRTAPSAKRTAPPPQRRAPTPQRTAPPPQRTVPSAKQTAPSTCEAIGRVVGKRAWKVRERQQGPTTTWELKDISVRRESDGGIANFPIDASGRFRVLSMKAGDRYTVSPSGFRSQPKQVTISCSNRGNLEFRIVGPPAMD